MQAGNKKYGYIQTGAGASLYLHLDEILQFGSEAIEMETAVFYRCMEIMNKEGIAILCVSDNSIIQNALIRRSEEDTEKFHKSREKLIPQLVLSL